VELDVSPGTTVDQVLAQLGIPATETRILFVDHRAATVAKVLSGGEQLGVFPAIGGG
jgi:sulfur-carrier protein